MNTQLPRLPGKRRINNLRNKILLILNGAKTHPEIRLKMPELENFFRKVKAQEFVVLIESSGKHDDLVYTVCWYHYGNTMHTAVEKCALATPERMRELYPMWREYADESRTYI